MTNSAKTSPPAARVGVFAHLKHPAVLLGIICSLTFVLYSATIGFEFVWDDYSQIVNNPIIRSFGTVARAFTSDLWYHTTRSHMYYRPLFICWSTLNYGLFGLKPWGWHLGAVLLHIAAIVAVYLLLRRLKLDYWTSMLATAIFAVHPVHVECVAWVSAASDTMVMILYVLAFAAFLHGREDEGGPARKWQAIALCLFACALFTKEMALTFPLMVAIYILLFPASRATSCLGSRMREAISAAAPYAVLTIAYLVVRKLVLQDVASRTDFVHTYADVILTVPTVLVHYLRLLLIPVGLTGLYFVRYANGPSISEFYVPCLILSVVAALVWYYVRRTGDKVVAFAALWSLATLLPALDFLVFTNGDFVRDRYLYLPSAGFVILMAKGIQLIPGIKGIPISAMRLAATGLLCAAFIIGCILQQVYWSTDVLVFYRGHTLYPENKYATLNLAAVLGRLGAHDRQVKLLQEILEKDPKYQMAYYQLTEAYIALGERERARRSLETALASEPRLMSSEMGKTYVAGLYTQLGDYDRAASLCSDVLAREPDLYAALYNCGNAQFLAGNDREAEKLLSRAIQVSPGLAEPNYFLGRTLLRMGRQAEAEKYLTIAATLQPQGYEYHYWLGQALEKRGAVSQAREQYLQTLKWKPDSEEAKQRLAALDHGASLSPASRP